jgi:HSP20 family protein
MTKLEKRPSDMLERLDRMFDEWTRFPVFHRMPMFADLWAPEGFIRVDEYREDGTLVVRAELPGIDPEKDLEITFAAGLLTIEAERREEEKEAEKGYVRRELRYGKLTRTLPLPAGADESDITAKYADGILEVRVPIAEPTTPPVTKIPVTAS